MRLSPPGTHFTAESTEAMQIKYLAQGENILMLRFEPATFVSKIYILTTTSIVQLFCFNLSSDCYEVSVEKINILLTDLLFYYDYDSICLMLCDAVVFFIAESLKAFYTVFIYIKWQTTVFFHVSCKNKPRDSILQLSEP